MRYDAEHKERTRERVLKEAAKAIRAKGPHGVSVAGVMGRAGLTHGGFYAHFKSKDALVAAGVERMFDEGRERLEAEIASHRSPRRGLAAYVDYYLSEEHRDARSWGCPLPFLAAEAPRLSPSARKGFAAGIAGLTDAIAEVLAEAGEPKPQARAASLLAEMVGALTLARAEPDRERSAAMLEASRRALRKRF